MRSYKDINNPTVGDIVQAMDVEGMDTGMDLEPFVRDREGYPSLYVVMDYLGDHGLDKDKSFYADTRDG